MNYYDPLRVLLVAPSRSGSTLLCHLLDSHPLVFCPREEPLLPDGGWRFVSQDKLMLLHCLLDMPGYGANVVKLTYRQLRDQGRLAHFLANLNVDKIIHLWRENVLDIALSAYKHTHFENPLERHSFEKRPAEPFAVNVAEVLREMQAYRDKVTMQQANLASSDLPVFSVTYEQIMGEDAPETFCWNDTRSTELCTFLGVDDYALVTYTRRINPLTRGQIITNWDELHTALEQERIPPYGITTRND